MKTFPILLLLLASNALAFGRGHSAPTPTPSPVPTATPTTSITPSPSTTPIPSAGTSADLRSCDGPVENQTTPWCTAFSITGVLENLVCDHNRLSIHHSWSFYEQYSVDEASAKVPGHNITTWDEWTESASNPKSDYLTFAKHQLTGMTAIDADDDIAEAFKVLDSGRPVYMGFSVPSDLAACYSIIRPTTGVTSGGHAVEIVGYGTDAKVGGGAYFIIKNSWGTDCGDAGYQYMPVSVCDLRGMYCELFEPKGAI